MAALALRDRREIYRIDFLLGNNCCSRGEVDVPSELSCHWRDSDGRRLDERGLWCYAHGMGGCRGCRADGGQGTVIFLAAHVHPPTHFHVQNLDAPVLSSQTAGVLSSARHHHPPLPPTTMNSTQAFQLFRACRSAVPARGVTRTAAVAARRRAATAGVRYYSDKSSAAESSEAKAGGKEGEGDAGTPSATSECEEKLKKKEAEVVDLTVRCPASRLIVHR